MIKLTVNVKIKRKKNVKFCEYSFSIRYFVVFCGIQFHELQYYNKLVASRGDVTYAKNSIHDAYVSCENLLFLNINL